MTSGDSLIRTMKQIGYNEADLIDESDFITQNKELKTFLDLFCLFNENNVLTTEQIQEYSALTPDELAKIEILKKNDVVMRCNSADEKKKEKLFLKEHLVFIENHNNSIERQIERFKKHEKKLFEEKETDQSLLADAKKKFQTYELIKIPQVEDELVLNLKSAIEIAEDLNSLIVKSNDSESSELPTSSLFKKNLQHYLDVEGELLRCINIYLEKNFLFQDDDISFTTHENLNRIEFAKESSFLEKKLKSNMIDKILTEKEAEKIKTMEKYFDTVNKSDISCHTSHLRRKLTDATEFNEQLKKKEDEHEAFINDAVFKYVKAVLTEVDLRVTEESLNNFQLCFEKLTLPTVILKNQYLRLQMLCASFYEFKRMLQNLKDLSWEVLDLIKLEESCLSERKTLIENAMADTAQKETEPYFLSVISSLNKILAVSEDLETSDSSKGSIENAIQKAEKYFEAQKNSKSVYLEKMRTIESVEENVDSVESLLNCTSKEYCDWHELEQSLNANLNSLAVKLTALQESMAKCSQELDQKQKLLERKGNLHLARNLYLYALTNMELFKKFINNIKIAAENSADHQ